MKLLFAKRKCDQLPFGLLFFYKVGNFKGSWEGQNLFKTNFRCIISMAKTISFYLVYSFSLKKYNFIEKTKFYSKKSERIYRKERFVKKNSNEFPKLLGICEFCKKPCIRNCYGRLTVKLKKDVKNVFFLLIFSFF